mmetsp:Transcript_107868/g.300787  ORF Transcript_107868/g.300787 Transcript_107868/m.300787 type:complete len:218 (-) Transcript_107868:53-706(-)
MGATHCLPMEEGADPLVGTSLPFDEDCDDPAEQPPAGVWLTVYDLGLSCGSRLLNGVLKPFGSGAFHCGVEVYYGEWSYCEGGVFCCRPHRCEGHAYHESVPMGTTPHPRYVVMWIIEMCKREWKPGGYDMLNHNCCHFCADLCQRLGVGNVPTWILSLANLGSKVAQQRCCQLQKADSSGDSSFEVAGPLCLSEMVMQEPAVSVLGARLNRRVFRT